MRRHWELPINNWCTKQTFLMRRKELVFPSEGSLFFIRVPVIIIAVNSLIGTSRRRDSLKKKGTTSSNNPSGFHPGWKNKQTVIVICMKHSNSLSRHIILNELYHYHYFFFSQWPKVALSLDVNVIQPQSSETQHLEPSEVWTGKPWAGRYTL